MTYDKYAEDLVQHISSIWYGNQRSVASANRAYYADPKTVVSIYCKHSQNDDVSNKDFIVDAVDQDNGVGRGIKTTVKSGGLTYEKVSELRNSLIDGKDDKVILENIRREHNARIMSAKREFGIDTMLYHVAFVDQKAECVYFREYEMAEISEETSSYRVTKSSFDFRDERNNAQYRWLRSKSTLFGSFALKDKSDGVLIPRVPFYEYLLGEVRRENPVLLGKVEQNYAHSYGRAKLSHMKLGTRAGVIDNIMEMV